MFFPIFVKLYFDWNTWYKSHPQASSPLWYYSNQLDKVKIKMCFHLDKRSRLTVAHDASHGNITHLEKSTVCPLVHTQAQRHLQLVNIMLLTEEKRCWLSSSEIMANFLFKPQMAVASSGFKLWLIEALCKIPKNQESESLETGVVHF